MCELVWIRLVDNLDLQIQIFQLNLLSSSYQSTHPIFVLIINLVLLISKKVVKVISENQKNVVINNVIQALRKMKSRGEVEIKVNLADVQLTSDHIKDYMRMVESVSSITVLEDSTVDKGGCVIETDFGQIDARISSQFTEIEKKILELAPIKTKGEE